MDWNSPDVCRGANQRKVAQPEGCYSGFQSAIRISQSAILHVSPKRDQIIPDIKSLIGEIDVPLTTALEGLRLIRSGFKRPLDARESQLFNSVETNMERSAALLKGALESFGTVEEEKRHYFDILDKIQQVCSTHDQLFLQRQLRYRVIASSDLPKVYADPNQMFVVLSNIISNAIKHAPRNSEINVVAKEVRLRQGAGVEVQIVNENPDYTERDRYQAFEKFYSAKESAKHGGVSLAVCREIVAKACGQLWVDTPSKGKVAFSFVLPCVEIKREQKPKGQQIFKYDITITNYKDIKDKMGREKSHSILAQVEECVRKLVRYPLDVVTTFEHSGVVSTIYETHEGHATSVATRISQKIGGEKFIVGNDVVPLTFKYHLSVLQ